MNKIKNKEKMFKVAIMQFLAPVIISSIILLQSRLQNIDPKQDNTEAMSGT